MYKPNTYYLGAVSKFLQTKALNEMIASIVGGVFGWLAFGLAFLVMFDTKGLKIDAVIAAAVIAFFIIKNVLLLQRLKNMHKVLGLSSDDELEQYLQECECLNSDFFKSRPNRKHHIGNMTFMSDRSIIDFNSCRVVMLSDIVSVKPCTRDRRNEEGYEYIYYYAKIKTADRKKIKVFFDNSGVRDKVIKCISAAADFSKGRKYID